MSRIKSKLPPIVDQWLLMPGHVLSQHIKDGTLTSVKLCELYIERIKQVNPHVNAMVQDRFEQALVEAKRVDEMLVSFRSGKQESEFSSNEQDMLRSPLLGVPISVKESIKVKGMKNSCGLWHRRNVCASLNAVVVDNAIRHGMIPICTTNTPECTMHWADCENKVYGRSKNPYDHSRVTGASSGGEGALLGAGGSVIGIGSDAGGSVRLPGQFCGIFSHKASHFLINNEGNYPDFPKSWLKILTFGPMCRYASDLRPMFKCMMADKNNPFQDTYVIYQPENITEKRKLVLERLDEQVDFAKIKIYHFNFNESSKLVGRQSVRVQDEIMAAQQEVVEHFRSKFNCQLEEINLDKFLKKAIITWTSLLCYGGETEDLDFISMEEQFKRALRVDNIYLELVKACLGLSKNMKTSLLGLIIGQIPRDEKKARKLVNEFRNYAEELKSEMESILGDSGVLIMPTLPTVAFKYGETLLKSNTARFTAMFNNIRLPVTHATLRLDKKNRLPYGFQIAASEFNDHLTLAFAEEIEAAFGGWRQPTVSSDSKLPDKIEAKSGESETDNSQKANNGTKI